MSGFITPRNVAIGGGILGAIFVIPRTMSQITPNAPASNATNSDTMSTHGVQNIENRFSSAGGSKNHTPAAGTPMGSESNITAHRQQESKGAGTPDFNKNHADQKDQRNQTGPEKVFNRTQLGSDKGK
ncbi:hypothetical protein LTR37_016134 [Vermiconidia calcicola]|uniref:Uncharacterized protein n=1 Tax=Vermiconidia calcicola TaxID=1690605 RepID=A0ACC3MQD1_9PEZI|nr:hypothetical protein LTR37_016134 [Vermiconidia calcicola]